ncbi:MAG: dTMP kinase [Candidatus Omnitrophota bacterium]|jgi:dTMP kinase
MAKAINGGLLITLEGPEGSGKSTQSKLLKGFLRRRGYKVLRVWDPGSTVLGESIRGMLLHFRGNISARAETMLYLASRAQLVDEKIIPAMDKGFIVICDRFTDATLCYQGYGLGIDKPLIRVCNRFVTRPVTVDIAIFLDTDVCEGLKRSRQTKGFSDRIEKRGRDFHNRVRMGYLEVAKKFPKRVKTISVDAKEPRATHAIVKELVLDVIKRRKRTR